MTLKWFPLESISEFVNILIFITGQRRPVLSGSAYRDGRLAHYFCRVSRLLYILLRTSTVFIFNYGFLFIFLSLNLFCYKLPFAQ